MEAYALNKCSRMLCNRILGTVVLLASMAGCGAGVSGTTGSAGSANWNYEAYDYFLPNMSGNANGRASVGKDLSIVAGNARYDLSPSRSVTEPVIAGKRVLSFHASEALMVCPQAPGSEAEAFLLSTRFNGGVTANAATAMTKMTDFHEFGGVYGTTFYGASKCQGYKDWQMSVDAQGNVLNARDHTKTGANVADPRYAVYKSAILDAAGNPSSVNEYYIVDRTGPELVVWTKSIPGPGPNVASLSANPDVKQLPATDKPRYQLLASVETSPSTACGPVTIGNRFGGAGDPAGWTLQTCPKKLSFEIWDNQRQTAGFASTSRASLSYDRRNTYCTFSGANVLYSDSFDATHPRSSPNDNGLRFGSVTLGAQWLSSVGTRDEPAYKWSLQTEEYLSGALPYGRQPADLTATCQIAVSEAGASYLLSASVTLKNVVVTSEFTQSTLSASSQSAGLARSGMAPFNDPPALTPQCGPQDCGRFGL
jgi:hypothetical protein